MRKSHVSAVAVAVATVLTASQASYAQEAATESGSGLDGPMEEIVVTAQKREESIQSVPLSVAAFSGTALARSGVDSALELSRLVPNMNISRAAQTAAVRLVIRGVGAIGNTAIDPSIGTFLDGVYVPRPGALFGQFNDIAAVEVLRGPQGTLFGRNSTVGGILLRSASPQDEFGGSAELQFGSYNQQRFVGTLNLPVSDRLAFRVAGLTDSRDGVAINRVTQQRYADADAKAGRLGMSWQLTDDLQWTVKYDWSRNEGDGITEIEIDPNTLTPASRARLNAIFAANPLDLDDPFDRRSNQRTLGSLDDKQYGVVSDLSWDIAGGNTVRLLSGYRKWDNEQYESDTLYLPVDVVQRTGGYESKSQSHELQLISPVDQYFGGRFDYVAGLYYFQEDYFIGEQLGLGADFCNSLVPVPGRPACNASGNKSNATVLDFNQDAENFAVYAQGNIGIMDSLDVVLGARWTKDDKTATFVQQRNNPFAAALRAPEDTALETNDDELTYRVGLNWTPSEDLLVFGSYSTGYKSGGFNSGGGAAALGQKRKFDKETVENVEAGVKWTLANGRAHVNGTLFVMELSDFQDRAFDGTSFNVINAGNMRNQGVELDADYAPTDWLTVNAGLSYLDAEFSEYPDASCLPYPAQVNPNCTQDLEGERPAYAPEWQGALGLQMQGDLGLAGIGYQFRTDLSYVDDINVGQISDNNPQNIQEAYSVVSARFSLLFGPNQRIAVSIFGDNLFDEEYCTARVGQPLDNSLGLRDPATGGTVMRCAVNAPRTYGISVKASF